MSRTLVSMLLPLAALSMPEFMKGVPSVGKVQQAQQLRRLISNQVQAVRSAHRRLQDDEDDAPQFSEECQNALDAIFTDETCAADFDSISNENLQVICDDCAPKVTAAFEAAEEACKGEDEWDLLETEEVFNALMISEYICVKDNGEYCLTIFDPTEAFEEIFGGDDHEGHDHDGHDHRRLQEDDDDLPDLDKICGVCSSAFMKAMEPIDYPPAQLMKFAIDTVCTKYDGKLCFPEVAGVIGDLIMDEPEHEHGDDDEHEHGDDDDFEIPEFLEELGDKACSPCFALVVEKMVDIGNFIDLAERIEEAGDLEFGAPCDPSDNQCGFDLICLTLGSNSTCQLVEHDDDDDEDPLENAEVRDVLHFFCEVDETGKKCVERIQEVPGFDSEDGPDLENPCVIIEKLGCCSSAFAALFPDLTQEELEETVDECGFAEGFKFPCGYFKYSATKTIGNINATGLATLDEEKLTNAVASDLQAQYGPLPVPVEVLKVTLDDEANTLTVVFDIEGVNGMSKADLDKRGAANNDWTALQKVAREGQVVIKADENKELETDSTDGTTITLPPLTTNSGMALGPKFAAAFVAAAALFV